MPLAEKHYESEPQAGSLRHKPVQLLSITGTVTTAVILEVGRDESTCLPAVPCNADIFKVKLAIV